MATIDNLMHRLWTKAKDTPLYNKKEWQVISTFIEANQGHNTPLSQHNFVRLEFEEKYPEKEPSPIKRKDSRGLDELS